MRGGWRLLIQGIAFLGGGILLQFLIGMIMSSVLAGSGINMQDAPQVAGIPLQPLIRLLSSVVIFALAVLTCSIAAKRLDKRPFQEYGFHFNRLWWADLGFGLLLGALQMLYIFLVERSFGWITVTPRQLNGTLGTVILINLLIYICVGVTEELFSRGYQVRNLAEALNIGKPRLAVGTSFLITSSLFGLLHLANPNASVLGTVLLMFIGLLMGVGYILTGELAMSIGLHITWNFFQGIVFGFPVSGSSHSASFLQIEQGGPNLWTGGLFGPEAGLVSLIACILGFLIVLAWVNYSRGKITINKSLAVYCANRVEKESCS